MVTHASQKFPSNSEKPIISNTRGFTKREINLRHGRGASHPHTPPPIHSGPFLSDHDPKMTALRFGVATLLGFWGSPATPHLIPRPSDLAQIPPQTPSCDPPGGLREVSRKLPTGRGKTTTGLYFIVFSHVLGKMISKRGSAGSFPEDFHRTLKKIPESSHPIRFRRQIRHFYTCYALKRLPHRPLCMVALPGQSGPVPAIHVAGARPI